MISPNASTEQVAVTAPSQWKSKWLFALLYLSEGAPIGYLWLALPTQLRQHELPITQITWMTSLLVLPWTFKFLWAPVIDLLQNRWWNYRSWIFLSQMLMGLTLTPLFWLDPVEDFSWMVRCLLLHAVCAATQDVAIDAYCIAQTEPGNRGAYNGWMQTGMMVGRAMMGGGALILSGFLGEKAIVGLLIFLTTFSGLLLAILGRSPARSEHELSGDQRPRFSGFLTAMRVASSDRNTWLGLAFALFGGAVYKSLEVFYGPFLIDRGINEFSIGWFSAVPMIGSQIAGALLGGWLSDRFGARPTASVAMVGLTFTVLLLAVCDQFHLGPTRYLAFPLLTIAGVGIGAVTASTYSLMMDISLPRLGATQFTGFMGATNGCESWSGLASGRLIDRFGYPAAMVVMSLVSILALAILPVMRLRTHQRSQHSSSK